MPNVKSAKKRMQLSRIAATRNRSKRSRIRTAIKKVRMAEDLATAREFFREAVSLIDRAAAKRLMHPNRAARLKQQLARKVNELAAG